jgi:hypothetical protein
LSISEFFCQKNWAIITKVLYAPLRDKAYIVSRLELKPWWRSYGMTDEDRAVAVSWTIE